MHPSASTSPDGLPAPPISGARSNSTHHHGNAPESSNNGRAGESKPSSSSSPPKSPSVSFSNRSPNNGNSISAPAAAQAQGHERRGGENPSPSGDMFLQWGQRKRSKRTVGDKFSGVRTMAPPPPPTGVAGKGGTKLRTSTNGVFSSSSLRNSCSSREESSRMGGSPPSKNQEVGSRQIASRSTTAGKRPGGVGGGGSIRKDKLTESTDHHHHLTSPAREAEALKADLVEWPRIYVALSRKEKEDDFFSIRGTKLPHRPKKRAKAIDKNLQYCFPGMWLSELSRARYEVRERKSVKKQQRRRGLKGLDSMETDSE